MLPGLVELHLLGTLEAPFLHLHPCPHQLQHCFSFYKTLEKHQLNTSPVSVLIKRGHPGGWGPKIPDYPNTLALGVIPISSRLGRRPAPSINPIPSIWHQHCRVLERKAHPSLGHWLGLWGQEHMAHSEPGCESGHQAQLSCDILGGVLGVEGFLQQCCRGAPRSSGPSSPLALSLGSESAPFFPPG